MKYINIDNVVSIKNLAETISSNLSSGDILLLSGDLGSGKTTLCKFIIKYFLPNIEVCSPTFSLINTYNTKMFTIWHCDFL